MRCPRCNREFQLEGADFCPFCGAGLRVPVRKETKPEPRGRVRVREYELSPEEAREYFRRVEDEIRAWDERWRRVHRKMEELFEEIWRW